jgi:rhodanese-related sulfurtransferase
VLGEIAAAWAVRLGYTNVFRYPAGYQAWIGK